MVFILYFISFISGFFVKWVDWIEDEKGGKDGKKFILAAFYGILLGYLMSINTITELFVGALLAQVFSRKIDTLAHIFGFFVAVLSLFFFGLPQQSLLFLFFFFVLAVLDEQTTGWRFRNFENYRLLLPIGAFIVAVLMQKWDYFFAIASFDIGYLLFAEMKKKEVVV